MSEDAGAIVRPGRDTARASARLGLTLRAVVISPAAGFESALKATARRQRSKQKPAEGVSPYLLAAANGVAWFLLWLKVGRLFQLRDAPEASYRAEYLVAAVLLGAVIGLVVQVAWSWLAARAAGIIRESLRRELRVVWGIAGLPQVLVLLVLLPLDLIVVGSQSFSTGSLDDPVSTAWAAASIALSIFLASWTTYLLVRGVRVATEVGPLRSVMTAIMGLLLLIGLFGPIIAFSAVSQ